MNNFGYIKVASAIPSVKVGDVTFNLQQAEEIIAKAEGKGVEIIVFPELSLTGYTCQDLFRQQILIDAAEQAVMMLLDFTRQLDIIAIVGLPVMAGNILLNCAAVIQKGSLLGLIPKTYLPNYSEFYERRYFEPFEGEDETEDGVPFGEDAPAGAEEPVRTAVFLFASEDRRGAHLRSLAMVAQTILAPGFAKRWLRARTPQQLRDIFLLARRIRAPK